MRKEDSLLCTCKNEECEYEFTTNAYNNIQCPFCGSESIDVEEAAGIIFGKEDNIADESTNKNIVDYSKGLFFRRDSKGMEIATQILKLLNIDVFETNIYEGTINEETECQFNALADELGVEEDSPEYNEILPKLQDAISKYDGVFSDFEERISDAVWNEYNERIEK